VPSGTTYPTVPALDPLPVARIVVYALFPDVIVVVTVAADEILVEELDEKDVPDPACAPVFDVAAARPFDEVVVEDIVVDEVVVEDIVVDEVVVEDIVVDEVVVFAETAKFCVDTDEEATLDVVVVDW